MKTKPVNHISELKPGMLIQSTDFFGPDHFVLILSIKESKYTSIFKIKYLSDNKIYENGIFLHTPRFYNFLTIDNNQETKK